jgi:hypothetical protein
MKPWYHAPTGGGKQKEGQVEYLIVGGIGAVGGLFCGILMGWHTLLAQLRASGYRVQQEPVAAKAARQKGRKVWRVGVVTTPATRTAEEVWWLPRNAADVPGQLAPPWQAHP